MIHLTSLRRRSGRPLATLLLGAAVVLLPAGPGYADRPCGAGYVTTFDGKYTSASTSIYGVRARIENRSIDLCGDGGSDGGVSAWTMLSAPSATSSNRINFAQVGYAKTGALSTYGVHDKVVFAFNTTQCYATLGCGQGDDESISVKFTTSAPPDGRNYYAVYLDSSTDRVTMAQNGNVIKALGYDVTGRWSATWFGQYFGETFDRGDDVPGTSANRTSFDYLQWYGSSGGINFFGDPAIHEDPVPYAPYKRDATTPASGGVGFDIWTDRS